MNLIIALLLVVAVMLATAGYMEWSSFRVRNQLRKLSPAVAYLDAAATTRAGITQQTKEIADCIANNSHSSGSSYKVAADSVSNGIDNWRSALIRQRQLGIPGKNEDLDHITQIQDRYRQWNDTSRSIIECCRKNEFARARKLFADSRFRLHENTILNGIDSAIEDGVDEVQSEFHLLILTLGRLPWSGHKALGIVERSQTTIDSVIALTRINSGLSDQLKELMYDRQTSRSGELSNSLSVNETRSAISDFRRSARRLINLGYPNGIRLLANAASLERDYQQFSVLFQEAMSSRHKGKIVQAAGIADDLIEKVRQEGILPNLRKSIEESTAELQKLNNTVGWLGAGIVVTGALLVIAALVASLKGILKTFSIMEHGTSAITAGDLSHRIDLPPTTELGNLARSFNSMTNSLEKSRSDLQRLNQELEKRVEERTSQLASANEDLRLFSSSVCHDLRSPLSAINGYSQLLLLQDLDLLPDQVKDTLCRIVESSSEMSDIIGALMKLARVSEEEIGEELVNLTLQARLVIGELMKQEPERKVTVEIKDGMSATGDTMLLRLMLENLLGNSWKYTARKEDGSIFFGCWQDEAETVYFVRDNGAGFDMKRADSLFKPFSRLHSSEEYTGSGIGLATVQRIISRHGGRIWAEGTPGSGATFYFTLSQPPKAL